MPLGGSNFILFPTPTVNRPHSPEVYSHAKNSSVSREHCNNESCNCNTYSPVKRQPYSVFQQRHRDFNRTTDADFLTAPASYTPILASEYPQQRNSPGPHGDYSGGPTTPVPVYAGDRLPELGRCTSAQGFTVSHLYTAFSHSRNSPCSSEYGMCWRLSRFEGGNEQERRRCCFAKPVEAHGGDTAAEIAMTIPVNAATTPAQFDINHHRFKVAPGSAIFSPSNSVPSPLWSRIPLSVATSTASRNSFGYLEQRSVPRSAPGTLRFFDNRLREPSDTTQTRSVSQRSELAFLADTTLATTQLWVPGAANNNGSNSEAQNQLTKTCHSVSGTHIFDKNCEFSGTHNGLLEREHFSQTLNMTDKVFAGCIAQHRQRETVESYSTLGGGLAFHATPINKTTNPPSTSETRIPLFNQNGNPWAHFHSFSPSVTLQSEFGFPLHYAPDLKTSGPLCSSASASDNDTLIPLRPCRSSSEIAPRPPTRTTHSDSYAAEGIPSSQSFTEDNAAVAAAAQQLTPLGCLPTAAVGTSWNVSGHSHQDDIAVAAESEKDCKEKVRHSDKDVTLRPRRATSLPQQRCPVAPTIFSEVSLSPTSGCRSGSMQCGDQYANDQGLIKRLSCSTYSREGSSFSTTCYSSLSSSTNLGTINSQRFDSISSAPGSTLPAVLIDARSSDVSAPDEPGALTRENGPYSFMTCCRDPCRNDAVPLPFNFESSSTPEYRRFKSDPLSGAAEYTCSCETPLLSSELEGACYRDHDIWGQKRRDTRQQRELPQQQQKLNHQQVISSENMDRATVNDCHTQRHRCDGDSIKKPPAYISRHPSASSVSALIEPTAELPIDLKKPELIAIGDVDEEERFILHLAIITLYRDQIKPYQVEICHRLQELHSSSKMENHFLTIYEALDAQYIVERAPTPAATVVYLRETPSWFQGWVDMLDPHNPYPLRVWLAFYSYIIECLRAPALLEDAPRTCTFIEPRGGRYGMSKRLKAFGPPIFRNYSLGQVCHIVQLAVHLGILAYEGACLLPAASCKSVIKTLFPPSSEFREQNGHSSVEKPTVPVEMPHAASQCVKHAPDGSKRSNEEDNEYNVQNWPVVLALEEAQRDLETLLTADDFKPMLLSQLKFRYLHRFKKRFDPVVFGFARLSDFLTERSSHCCRLIRENGRQIVVDRVVQDSAPSGQHTQARKEGHRSILAVPSTNTEKCESGCKPDAPYNPKLYCRKNLSKESLSKDSTSRENKPCSNNWDEMGDTDRVTKILLGLISKHSRFHFNISYAFWQYTVDTQYTSPDKAVVCHLRPGARRRVDATSFSGGLHHRYNVVQTTSPSSMNGNVTPTKIPPRTMRDDLLFGTAAEFSDFLFASVLRPASTDPPVPAGLSSSFFATNGCSSSDVKPMSFRDVSVLPSTENTDQATSAYFPKVCSLRWFTRRPLIERQLGQGKPLDEEDSHALQEIFFAVLPLRLPFSSASTEPSRGPRPSKLRRQITSQIAQLKREIFLNLRSSNLCCTAKL